LYVFDFRFFKIKNRFIGFSAPVALPRFFYLY
jgi:hypothetical protein